MNIELHKFKGMGQSLGTAIGQQFGQQIRAALADNSELHERFRPYHLSSRGQSRFQQLLALHEQHYAPYVAELRGCAQGAQVPFEDLFLVNLRGEYRGYAAAGRSAEIGECSTCSLLTRAHAVFGHNEDGAEFYRNRSYLIHVEPLQEVAFMALCYPGFLPSNAFGANQHGLCYSINNVRPTEIRQGLGRHFLARSLLQARSLDDAVACLSIEPRAAGFNFTLASIAERRILNVETSPSGIHIHEITGRYFHANHYLHLNLEQQCAPSSMARQDRAETLFSNGTATDRAGVLKVLRDQGNSQLPIWRQGRDPDPSVTLLSALFDLDAATLDLYPGPLDSPPDSPQTLIRVSLDASTFGREII